MEKSTMKRKQRRYRYVKQKKSNNNNKSELSTHFFTLSLNENEIGVSYFFPIFSNITVSEIQTTQNKLSKPITSQISQEMIHI